MSTTIEVSSGAPAVPDIAGELLRFLRGALVVVAVWFAGLAAVTLLAQPTSNVMVFGGQERALGAIVASDGLIVEQGVGFMVGRGEHAGFVRALYRNGAWLVLPSLAGGCVATPGAAALPRR